MRTTAQTNQPRTRRASNRAEKLHTNIRPKLEDLEGNILWGQIARDYFNKSASWLYNKLKGIDGNGGVGGFTDEELLQFKGALCDLADRIRKTADKL